MYYKVDDGKGKRRNVASSSSKLLLGDLIQLKNGI